jgi:hypothetical protein
MSDGIGTVDVDVQPPRYYFCLDHGVVEGVDGCRGEVRLGPYASFDEASRALETARRRTEQWDEEDEEWDTKKPPP